MIDSDNFEDEMGEFSDLIRKLEKKYFEEHQANAPPSAPENLPKAMLRLVNRIEKNGLGSDKPEVKEFTDSILKLLNKMLPRLPMDRANLNATYESVIITCVYRFDLLKKAYTASSADGRADSGDPLNAVAEAEFQDIFLTDFACSYSLLRTLISSVNELEGVIIAGPLPKLDEGLAEYAKSPASLDSMANDVWEKQLNHRVKVMQEHKEITDIISHYSPEVGYKAGLIYMLLSAYCYYQEIVQGALVDFNAWIIKETRLAYNYVSDGLGEYDKSPSFKDFINKVALVNMAAGLMEEGGS